MSRVLASEVLRSAVVVFGLPMEDLTGRRRDFKASRPRNLACRAIRTLCPHVSYPEIGRMLGGRDHTTIVKNVAKTDQVLSADPKLAAAYDRLLLRATIEGEAAKLDQDIADAEARVAALRARRAALFSEPLTQPGA